MINISALPVLTSWEEFVQEEKNNDLNKFANWLLKKNAPHSGKKPKTGTSLAKMNTETFDEKAMALLLISRIQKKMQQRLKPVLKSNGFAKEHEYNVLIHVSILENPSKTKVAEQLMIENTTAVEIINRLVRRGYLKETKHNDKRATGLAITASGKKKLEESNEKIAATQAGIINSLNHIEAKQLVVILKKIEQAD